MKQEWLTEPNSKEFEYKGYKCFIVRKRHSGSLCGYVEIPNGHALHRKDYQDIDILCHGGLTYSDNFNCLTKETTDNWYLGFDCAHYLDLVPNIPILGGEIYRNMEYVTKELENIVNQIIGMSNDQ